MLKRRIWLVLIIALLAALPASAQDTTIRNPEELAQRWLGYNPMIPAIPLPSPAYGVGDEATFWVSKTKQDAPSQITTIAAAVTPSLYIFVEEGLTFDPQRMAQLAQLLDSRFALLRLSANQGGITVVPESRADFDALEQVPFSDIDNDPHFYVLYTRDLNTVNTTLYNPVNPLPERWVSNGWSNEHEMLLVNTTLTPNLDLTDEAYISRITRQFYTMLAFNNQARQPVWLREALSWRLLFQLDQRELTIDDIGPFFAAPNTSLTSGDFGAGQAFLSYLQQRFGPGIFSEISQQSGTGLRALDRALEIRQATDTVSGEPITALDVFGDFVMANVFNGAIGDGRFGYSDPAFADLRAEPLVIQDEFNFQTPQIAVNQFGSTYLLLTSTAPDPVDFTLVFQGLSQTPRLPIPGEVDNHFYWSGNTINANTSMVRSFDLTAVNQASLSFDAWYVMSNGWNYGYVSISEDDGESWQIIPTSLSTSSNPYGLGYGAGLTGFSSPEQPRPFPFLGVNLDGMAITNIMENSPLAGTEVRPGDVLAGHDGAVWAEGEDIFSFLAQFRPGDTISLYMQREDEFYSVEVVLGTHPVRVINPDPIWVTQSADLSGFAGKTILIRFDYISAAENPDLGIAIDNIAIPEIDYLDDAESGVQGWTLSGWQQMRNETEQQFLVQFALLRQEGQSQIGRLLDDQAEEPLGGWDFTLQPNDLLILTVSGINADTNIPGLYQFAAQERQANGSAPEDEPTPTVQPSI